MDIELNQGTRLVAVDHQSSCQLADEAVILNLRSGIYFGLNSVGLRVWEMLQEGVTVARIHGALVDEFDVASERCLQDLMPLLQSMVEAGLVEVRSEDHH